MLLNPSHKITCSGLPPDVLDAYVRYKKGTRALVTWFIQYSPLPDRRAKSLPIKELEVLAQAASKKLRSLPDIVHFYFRETIAARKRLSKYWRGQLPDSNDDIDTVNHEHFTARLSKIYNDLCESCGQPCKQHHASPTAAKETEPSAEPVVNQFSKLSVEETVHEGDVTTLLQPPSPAELAIDHSPAGDDADVGLDFTDDGLGTLLEVTTLIQRVQEICRFTENCWNDAGEKKQSIALSALATNVAFASIRRAGAEVFERHESLTISTLDTTIGSLNGSTTGMGVDPAGRQILDQLRDLESALLQGSRSGRPSTAKPWEHLKTCVHPDAGAAADFADVLIENIRSLVSGTAIPGAIVRNGSPIYAEIGYYITRAGSEFRPWSAVLGLLMLTAGFKAYIASVDGPNAVAQNRVTALRLAQSVSSQIGGLLKDKTCFPCRCQETLAYHLEHVESELHGYMRHRSWDLYFQSPWVVGNHLLEILDLSHYYGLKLLSYRHYVGAVVHSYNVLRQLGGLDEILVLENLSQHFTGIFFPGGSPPRASFRACWGRYVGARIKFKKGHKRNSRDNWCMAIPAHAARRAAGLGSGDARDGTSDDCLLFKVKQQDYNLAEGQWASLQSDDTVASRRRSSSTTAPNPTTGENERLSSLIQSLRPMVDQCDARVLPIARLNLFAVFEACVQAVSKLSDATHTAQADQGINCICFANSILTAADRICDGRRLGHLEGWRKAERECVETVKSTFTEVFHDHGGPTRWLWAL